jgi:molecular chaperone GrpE (heat shock protein)
MDPKDTKPTPEALAKENAELKAQLAAKTDTEKAIAAKMAQGLTRAQAEASLRNQAKYAAAKAKK